jgi:hypothetical protein
MPIYAKRFRNRIGRLALCRQPSDLVTHFGGELRPTDLDALARDMPAIVRSLIFYASILANDDRSASRMLRTSSLSVARSGSVLP